MLFGMGTRCPREIRLPDPSQRRDEEDGPRVQAQASEELHHLPELTLLLEESSTSRSPTPPLRAIEMPNRAAAEVYSVRDAVSSGGIVGDCVIRPSTCQRVLQR